MIQPELYELVVLKGADAGRRLALQAEVTVGRAPDCDLQFSDPLVSRLRAGVRPADGGVWVEDLRSSNGTKVNGVSRSRSARAH